MLAKFQRAILFPRAVPQVLPDRGRVPGLEPMPLETPEGRVEAFFLPAHGDTASRPAVVFAHGNAELIDYWTRELETYRALGIAVFLPEYRGYGASAGRPSEATLTRDFVAFYDALAARPDVDASRIGFHGRSLGGGVLAQVALERPPAALILESSFTSVSALAWERAMPGFLVVDRFDTERALRRLEAPTLLIHGTRDRIVPFHHAERNAEAKPQSQLKTFDAGHNDVPRGDEYWDCVTAFLRKTPVLPRA